MDTVPYRIIVVDDDASIRDALVDYLARHGYTVHGADGAVAFDRMRAQAPVDLVVLDWMMPGEDGLSVCRRLAGSATAVLMLSALDTPPDRVIGLEVGADDYLAKPFDPRELLARVRALLRRGAQLRQVAGQPATGFVFDGWTLRADTHVLTSPAGEPLTLTAGEFALLHALVDGGGRVLDRERLMTAIHGDTAEPFDRAIDLAVSRLRRKLAHAVPGADALVQTLRGVGYRFAATVRRL
ncbi:MAG: response regulator transcription factor [Luteimonas sp.]